LTYNLTSVVGNGQPQSVTVIPAVSGVGAVTVKYDGVANPPAEPGTTRLSVAPGIYIVSDGGAFRRKAAVARQDV
jgi:hypothetical protein